jgi:hypothetical protein
MMTFKTASGSLYEVDHAQSRVRRISGTHAPTRSQGADGEWRQYHSAFIELGLPAIIHWNPNNPRHLVTSRVTGLDLV